MKKTKAELEQLDQGARLLKFMFKNDFNDNKRFAEYIGVSSSSIDKIIRNELEITKKTLIKIAAKFNDLDSLWLLTGRKSKLSTIQPDIIIEDTFNEEKNNYITIHEFLKEKDLRIANLEDRIIEQKTIIESLQRCLDELKSPETKKTGARSG